MDILSTESKLLFKTELIFVKLTSVIIVISLLNIKPAIQCFT